MEVRLVAIDDAARLSKFYEANETHLQAWEPSKSEGHHSEAAWKARLQEWCSPVEDVNSFHFISIEPGSDEVVAMCSLTNVVKGPFRACYMGYAVDHRYEGRGVMKALCQRVIDYAFTDLSLNRVMANYMPRNDRSAMLLKSLGFVKEGEAKRYLKINGVWEDHILTSLLNPAST
ncbi:GNAT family N-acetyltransferase [Microbulbifer agarilyticus]|uniref:GNAT family N-acetyltransferase n=1 Tax=Microbulbifer agarilyticus TaxID=260552 RepID=UPI001C93B20F|nr:GNAT family N-acetyltransferase [Microbulbifer agarilyticus]MBY6192094.1 GNAT family N-acetyltransferase [Microbulbifer agarilyticus]